MNSNFFCKNPHINLYKKLSYKSKISSQILYGEKFRILLKKKKFIKVKTSYDNYIGYIKLSNHINKFKPTHKVSVLKSRIFKCPESPTKLIHAYGPKKRVIIMPIKKTIYQIEKTANLKVKKISRI